MNGFDFTTACAGYSIDGEMPPRYNEINNRTFVSNAEKSEKAAPYVVCAAGRDPDAGLHRLCGGSPRAINAYKAPADISIGGDLTEWNATSPATINVEAQVMRDPGQWKEKDAENLSGDVAFDLESLLYDYGYGLSCAE